MEFRYVKVPGNRRKNHRYADFHVSIMGVGVWRNKKIVQISCTSAGKIWGI